MTWVRLWDDMPTDPKWRVIAKRSGRPISEVLSVFVFMMTNAGRTHANATERGTLLNWSDEDVGAALDIDSENVASIREAMQGKVLDGDRLTGWETRQPKREDNSAERAKAWREARKAENASSDEERTHANATERNQTPRVDTDTDNRNLKVPCPKPVRTRKAYPEKFQEFWEGYPTDNLMSKSEAGKAWDRLTEDDQALALASLTAFKSHCAQHPDYRPVHACRYLSQRRFEGFGKFARDLESTRKIWVKVGSPQFDAWNSWWQDTKSKSMPQANGGWYVPSEFPPSRRTMEAA